MIAHWIYLSCDEDAILKKMDNPKSSLMPKALKYGTAEVMRSAVSYGFGILLNRGQGRWTQTGDGKYIGNPSLSTKVMMYLRSLKRKKVKGYLKVLNYRR